MCLETVGKIVEATIEGHTASVEATGEVVDFVADGIPLAGKLFGGGIRGRFNGVALCDERIEIDHLNMVVEGIEDCFSRNACRKASDSGEVSSLGHGGEDASRFLLSLAAGCEQRAFLFPNFGRAHLGTYRENLYHQGCVIGRLDEILVRPLGLIQKYSVLG